MKTLFALLAVVGIFKAGECAITDWTKPVIATAAGFGTLTNKINDGVTTGTATGITITATSNDNGGVTPYTLVSQDPTTPDLEIDGTTGIIAVTSGTVSYSTSTSFTLVVSANDAGNTASTATVTLNVNAAPVITPQDSSVCIADGSTENVCLIDLAATDPNAGTTIEWAIESGNTNADFAITSAGIVQVATGKTLAMATTATYTLVITAADDSSTPLTATTTVTASVQTTCTSACLSDSATAIAISLMTILAALIVAKLC